MGVTTEPRPLRARAAVAQDAGMHWRRAVLPLTVTDRLSERRYIAAGDRAYVIGVADGSFPAMGWHIKGEMGGLWSPPIKLLDGYWFSVDGQPLGAATRFTTSFGHAPTDPPK